MPSARRPAPCIGILRREHRLYTRIAPFILFAVVLSYCGSAHETDQRTVTHSVRDTEHILNERHPEIIYRPISFSPT
ncbi:MAG: hypothetical protein KDK34_17940, partial [Leptospiraceae bacterium]|nr:hypothetical protein [Leptospiraceae bacterium]